MGPPLSVIRKKPKLNFWADTPHLKTCTIYGQPTKESAYVQNVKSLQNMSLYGGQGKFLSIVRGYLSLIPSCQLPDSELFLCCVPICTLLLLQVVMYSAILELNRGVHATTYCLRRSWSQVIRNGPFCAILVQNLDYFGLLEAVRVLNMEK